MFKVMYKVAGHWTVEHFDNENEARNRANWAFTTGAVQVELYRKSRVGYEIVKKVRQTVKQAVEREANRLIKALDNDPDFNRDFPIIH